MDTLGQRKQKRAQAITHMLEGRSDREIAEILNVSRVAVWKWRQEPAIHDQLMRANALRIAATTARMQAFGDEAVERLVEHMRDRDPLAKQVSLKATIELMDRLGIGVRDEKLKQEVQREIASFVDAIERDLPKDTAAQVVELAVKRSQHG